MAEEKLLGIQRLDTKELGNDVATANAQLKKVGDGTNLDLTSGLKKQVDSMIAELKKAASEAKKATSKNGGSSGSKGSANKDEERIVTNLAKAYRNLYDIQAKVKKSADASQSKSFWKAEEAAAKSALKAIEQTANQTGKGQELKQRARALESVTKAQQRLNAAVAASQDKKTSSATAKTDAAAKKQAAQDQAKYNSLLQEQHKIQKEILKVEASTTKSSDGDAAKQRQLATLKQQSLTITQQLNALETSGIGNAEKKAALTRDLERAQADLNRRYAEGNEQVQEHSSILEKVSDTLIRLATMAFWNTMHSAWNEATTFAKEYYDAMNDIRMVTGQTESQAQNLGNSYIKQAQKMSVNSSEIAAAAVEFYRQGLDSSEVEKRLTATIQYAKVAGLEFTEAAELMTAATNSMDLDARRVADVFAYLGDASASGADEIGQAMQKASASAQEAGVSFEWLGAYIASVSEKTRQAPEVIGTAFNSMMARLHNIRARGFNEEDETKINDVAKALAKLPEPLQLINSLTGEWVDMSTIFEEVARQWSSLDDETRAYLATTIAGTKQQNVFLTLMNDMGKATEGASRTYELYAGALESSGSVAQKYAIYQESVAASLDNMKAKWQEFVNLFNGGDIFKDLYDFVGNLIEGLTAATKATDGWNLKLVAIGAAGVAVVSVVQKISSAIGVLKTTLLAADKLLSVSKIGLIVSAVAALAGVIGSVVIGVKNANDELRKSQFDSYASKVESNVSSLRSLVSRYEEQSTAVNKSEDDYKEMSTILESIKGLAPQYEKSLTDAQGNITESVRIANEALAAQEQKLRDIAAIQAAQKMADTSAYANGLDQSRKDYNDFILGANRVLNTIYTDIYMEQVSFNPAEYNNREEYGQALINGYNRLDSNGHKSLNDGLYQLTDALGISFDGYMGESSLEELMEIYDAWSAGIIASTGRILKDSLDSAVDTAAKDIVDANQARPEFVELSETRKNAVLEMIENDLTAGIQALKTGESSAPVISAIQAKFPDYVSAVASDIMYDAQDLVSLVTGDLSSSSTIDTSSFELVVRDWIQNGIAPELISAAFTTAKKFYGEEVEPALVDLIHKEDPREMLGIMSDHHSLTTHHLLAAASGMFPGSSFDKNANVMGISLFDSQWIPQMDDGLKKLNLTMEETDAVYKNLTEAIASGKVSLEDMMLYKEDPEKLVNMAVAMGDQEDQTEAIEHSWDEYITKAAAGGTEYADVVEEIYGKMQKVSELQGHLAITQNPDGISPEIVAASNEYLENEYGTSYPEWMPNFVDASVKEITDGIAYLYSKQFEEKGAAMLIDVLGSRLSSGGMDPGKMLIGQLQDRARADSDPASKLVNWDALFGLIEYDSNGMVANLGEIASIISSVDTAIAEGTMSWQMFSDALNNGATASELFGLTYKQTADEVAKTKWDEYANDFTKGTDEDSTNALKAIKEEAQHIARSQAMLNILRSGKYHSTTTENAKSWLLDEYGTLDPMALLWNIDSRARSFEQGTNQIRGLNNLYANHALIASGMMEGYMPSSVAYKQLYDMADVSGNTAAVESLKAQLDSTTMSAETMAAMFYTMYDAIESGFMTWEEINALAGDSFSEEGIMQLFDVAAMREFVAGLEELASSTEGADRLSFMESIFGEGGQIVNEDAMANFVSALEYMKATGSEVGEELRESLGLSKETWEDIADGGEMAADSMKDVEKAMKKLKRTDTSRYFKQSAKALWDLEDGAISAEEAFKEFYSEAETAVKAQEEFAAANEKISEGTAVTGEEVATLAEYLGFITPDTLLANWDNVGSLLAASLQEGENAFRSLQEAAFINITGVSSCDFSTLEGGLLSVQGMADDTVRKLVELGMFKQETIELNGLVSVIEGGKIVQKKLSGWQTVLRPTGKNPLGYGGYTSPKSSGGGGGGGGGGGDKKVDPTIDEQKMVDRMDWELDLVDDALSRNDTIMSRYESQGYLTGVINQLKQEEELLTKQGKLYEDNLAKLEAEMQSRKSILATLTEGTPEYDDVLAELEVLQDAYKNYSQAQEENENALLDNTEAMEEQYKAIRQLEIDIRDEVYQAFEDRAEREEDMLDARIEMENKILDVIIKRHEKERDEIIETTNLKIKALEDEMTALDEAFEERKRKAEEEDKQAELEKLELQYNRIVADPTRAKEALEIQKQILDLRDEISWDLAEDEVNSQKDTIDQQITSLEDYMEYMENYYEDLLSNPRNFIEEVNSILSMTQEDIIEWLKANDEDYFNSLDSTRTQMESDWRETHDAMNGIIKTYWEEVENIVSQGDEAILQFLMEHRQDYQQAGKLQAEAYVDEWKEKLENLKKAYLDIQEEVNEHPFLDTAPTTSEESTGSGGGGGSGSGGKSSQTKKQWKFFFNGKWYEGYRTEAGAMSDILTLPLPTQIPLNERNRIRQAAKDSLAAYAHGGLANFTGPAWLDGTPGSPERILSPFQTKLFESMVDALQTMATVKAPAFMMSPTVSQTAGNSGNTFGDIIVNVESLSKDEDYEEVARRVGDAMLRMMNKGNAIGGMRYSF